MDVQAANLLATLRRTSAPPEQKLTLLSNLKSDIKHYRVPDQAQAPIFECLKIAIAQQTSINIVTAALSTLGHLIKRLKIQDPDGRAISTHAPKLYSTLQDRLGDPRDSHRVGAQQAFIDLYPFCAPDVEHIIREEAIGGSHVRAKEMGMQWVVRMHEEEGLAFKTFVPVMVACLEDADGITRDAAKAALVDLFRTASTPAKNDLKKQLKLHMVRQSIATQILAQIGASDKPERPLLQSDFAASTRSLPAFDHISQFAESINSDEAKPPPPEEVQMDPTFVHSQRELEDIFRDMLPHFEGRESEENWLLRDKDITKLRRLTKGNAPSEFHSAYMLGLKQLQEGTLKAANSLRTTMMTNGCQLVQELARTLGPAMESMVENYLQSFIKMCAATKSLAQQSGNYTVDTIFQYVSYNVRHVQHVWLAAQDKNKQPRVFAALWLRTILGRQSGSRNQFEHSGGLELAEKTIKKCLTDADPKVKESMRATYWAFAKTWPDRAEVMMNSFDDKVKSALERDPHNPNAANGATNFSASTASRTSGARSALRDRIAAAKKTAQAQPGRPVTAMASMSPAKSKSMANLGARAKAMGPPPSASRVPSTMSVMSSATTDSLTSSMSTSTTRPNSLMSGAARRPVKRPELSRPATADPYATRKVLRPETPNKSPSRSPGQGTAAKSTAAQSTIARNRIGRLGSPAASPLRNPHLPKSVAEPRPLSRDALEAFDETSRSRGDDFTMVLPSVVSRETASSAAKKRPEIESSKSYDTAVQALGIEDDFTLVLPSAISSSTAHREKLVTSNRTPTRANSEEASSSIPSPTNGRLASPRQSAPDRRDTPQPETTTKSQSRQGSPLKTFSAAAEHEEAVRIYEDPYTASAEPSTIDRVAEPPSVLTELPVNNQSPPGADEELSTNGVAPHPTEPLSPPASPQSKAEKLRSRKLLQSGIQRIRARTLDTHGYRKVLDLTRTIEASDLFGTSPDDSPPRLYDDLVAALCDFLATPPGTTPVPDRPSSRTSGPEVKRQAFALLRSLLRSTSTQPWNEKGNYPTRALTATLEGRKHLEPGLPAKDAETLVNDVLALASNADIQSVVQTFLQKQISSSQDEAVKSDASAKATALALRTLTSTLRNQPSPPAETATPAQVIGPFLSAPDAESRKAAVDAAVELYLLWPSGERTQQQQQHDGQDNKKAFWPALAAALDGDVPESTKNLVVYFVARREAANGVAR
ncbi:hypothetical protein ANO11243_025060 [Dothideomycetidae sp. 11243]|nr:hypothetical protein ANO11243_025060 [fungal sp. No.11243]